MNEYCKPYGPPAQVEDLAIEKGYLLICGGMRLKVSFYDNLMVVTDQDRNYEIVSVHGETTALHTRASELIQERVNAVGDTFTYDFATGFPTMMDWARAHGEEIFQWTVLIDSDGFFHAERVFEPQNGPM